MVIVVYIIACFLGIAACITAIAFYLAPNEWAEIRAMAAVRRARKRGQTR